MMQAVPCDVNVSRMSIPYGIEGHRLTTRSSEGNQYFILLLAIVVGAIITSWILVRTLRGLLSVRDKEAVLFGSTPRYSMTLTALRSSEQTPDRQAVIVMPPPAYKQYGNDSLWRVKD